MRVSGDRPSVSEPFYPHSRRPWLLSPLVLSPEGLLMKLEHLLMHGRQVQGRQVLEECLEGDLRKSGGGGNGRRGGSSGQARASAQGSSLQKGRGRLPGLL